MTKKLNLRDRLEDYTLDLSMSDLDEVPVKDIALIKKGTHLDLSINKITTLGNNFATLIHITKLDLSKNLLTTLPDNFGALVNLKHLDLYKNQIVHLPLSMSKLKALRWLDLKDNPLMPTLAEIAGPCLDQQQCQQCARKIVALLSDMQLKVEVEIVERKRKEAEAAQKKEEQQKEEAKKSNKKAKSQKGKDKKKENGVKNIVHASGDNLARRPIHVIAPKTLPVVKSKVIKPSGSFCGKFFKLLFMLVIASSFALTTLWLVDRDMFMKVHRVAGDVWVQFVSQLPPQVVDVGNRAVEAARPTIEQACIHLGVAGKQMSLKIQDGYSWLSSQEIVQQALTHTKKFWEDFFAKATELYKSVF